MLINGEFAEVFRIHMEFPYAAHNINFQLSHTFIEPNILTKIFQIWILYEYKTLYLMQK